MKLYIASYIESEVNPDHVKSMVKFVQMCGMLDIEVEYVSKNISVHPVTAKNEFVFDFLASSYTHLMMVSPELSWEINGSARILKMAKGDFDVAAGVYSRSGMYGVNLKLDDGYPTGVDTKDFRVVEANSVSPGFMIVRREVFEKLKPGLTTYEKKGEYGEPDKEITEFFKGGAMWGAEDLYFQEKLIENGIQIFVEPNITFGFMSKHVWTGNFNQFLLEKK